MLEVKETIFFQGLNMKHIPWVNMMKLGINSTSS